MPIPQLYNKHSYVCRKCLIIKLSGFYTLSGNLWRCQTSSAFSLVVNWHFGKSHTRTVVRECCKDDDQSQWERPKFNPSLPLNPFTNRHQNLPVLAPHSQGPPFPGSPIPRAYRQGCISGEYTL